MKDESHSEHRKSLLGNEYTQHFKEGEKSGHSENKESILGQEYEQHQKVDGKTTGWSEEKTSLLGNEYTQQVDTEGKKAGWPEEREDLLGNKSIHHYNQEGNEISRTEERTSLLGEQYQHHEGVTPQQWLAEAVRSRSWNLSPVGVVLILSALIAGFVLLAIVGTVLFLMVLMAGGMAAVAVPLCLASAFVYWHFRSSRFGQAELSAVAIKTAEKNGKVRQIVDERFIKEIAVPSPHISLLSLPALAVAVVFLVMNYERNSDFFSLSLIILAGAGAIAASWFSIRLLLHFLTKRAVLKAQGLR